MSGQIVVTSSVAGLRAIADNSAYVASKFAVEGLVESVRLEAKPFNVKVATVNPACINTTWWKDETRDGKVFGGPAAEDKMINPESVAESILYICDQPSTSDVRRVVIENN
eukprot:GDKJ01047981.1.p1 GENE.GDKJ01047981.1~~GDKJ01047981.1.p1  ORF type:complete len:111 (+),score=31.30 GDKJ01047981.1:190-522(+)